MAGAGVRRPSRGARHAAPLPALLVVRAWCRRRGAFYALDPHTGVFNDPKWAWALRLTLRLARSSRTTIVTNGPLAARVQRAGGHAVVLDNRPEQDVPEGVGGGGIVLPCSWARDEPIHEMLQGVVDLGVAVTVTGRARPSVVRRYPSVSFPGHVDDDDYASLLHRADVVLAMTTRPLTMSQAGYEAMARHVPFVTSDTEVLRSYFTSGTVFSARGPAAVRAAVSRALGDQQALREEMRALHAQRSAEWDDQLAALQERLGA